MNKINKKLFNWASIIEPNTKEQAIMITAENKMQHRIFDLKATIRRQEKTILELRNEVNHYYILSERPKLRKFICKSQINKPYGNIVPGFPPPNKTRQYSKPLW